MNIRAQLKAEYFLSGRSIITFTRMALLHGIVHLGTTIAVEYLRNFELC
jgi:hypothetical protein